jgi:hypothetical protein
MREAASTTRPTTAGWTFHSIGCWKRTTAKNDLLVCLDTSEGLYKVHVNDRYEAAFREFLHATEWADRVDSGAVQQVPLIVALGAPDLLSLRRDAADAAYQRYDFGPGVEVEDHGGWEYSSGPPGKHGLSAEWTRPVFIRCPETDSLGSPTTRLTMVVRFESVASTVLEAYAIDDRGTAWGRASGPAPANQNPDASGATIQGAAGGVR